MIFFSFCMCLYLLNIPIETVDAFSSLSEIKWLMKVAWNMDSQHQILLSGSEQFMARCAFFPFNEKSPKIWYCHPFPLDNSALILPIYFHSLTSHTPWSYSSFFIALFWTWRNGTDAVSWARQKRSKACMPYLVPCCSLRHWSLATMIQLSN